MYKIELFWLRSLDRGGYLSHRLLRCLGSLGNEMRKTERKRGNDLICCLFRRPSLFTALPIRLRCMIICCQLLPTRSAAALVIYVCPYVRPYYWYYYDTFSIRLLRSFHTVPVGAVLLDTSPRPPHTSTECSHGNYSLNCNDGSSEVRSDHPRHRGERVHLWESSDQIK